MTYYNILYIQIYIWEKNNFARVTSEPKKAIERLDFVKTTYNDFVLKRSEFLRHNGAPNESLRLIIINYMFKYTFGIKTILLESLQNQKTL